MSFRAVVRLGLLALLALGVAAGLAYRGRGRDPSRWVVVVPTLERDAAHLLMLGVAEALVDADVRFGAPTPALAETWRDEGGGRFVFRLRPGVVFHDGRPLTAAAVVESLARAFARGDAAWLGEVLTVRAAGDDVVEVTASSPTFPVPGYLARVPVLAPGAWDAAGRIVAPVGTGPFAVERLDPDGGATLRAHRRWWGGGPAIEAIDVRVVKDPGTRVAMLEAGEADWVQRVPRHDVERLARAGFRAPPSAYLYNVYVVFRAGPRGGPAADVAVRRAVALAVDRARLARVAFGGGVAPAYGVFPPGHPLAAGDPAAGAPDPAEAERRLDAAGWTRPRPGATRVRDGVALVLPLLTVADAYRPAWATAAELLRQDLEAVGVRVEVEVLERGAWAARVAAGDFTATVRGRVPGWWPDPYGVLRTDFRSDGTNNPGRFSSAAFDRALDAAFAAADDDARGRALREAVDVLAVEVPVVPLVHDTSREQYVAAPDVAGADEPWARLHAFPGPSAHR